MCFFCLTEWDKVIAKELAVWSENNFVELGMCLSWPHLPNTHKPRVPSLARPKARPNDAHL